jgi:hypothetical protein
MDEIAAVTTFTAQNDPNRSSPSSLLAVVDGLVRMRWVQGKRYLDEAKKRGIADEIIVAEWNVRVAETLMSVLKKLNIYAEREALRLTLEMEQFRQPDGSINPFNFPKKESRPEDGTEK